MFYPFKRRLLTTRTENSRECSALFYPFKKRLLTTHIDFIFFNIYLFYPFERRLLTTCSKKTYMGADLFYPFKRKLLTTPFYVMSYNKGIYIERLVKFSIILQCLCYLTLYYLCSIHIISSNIQRTKS